MPLARSLNCDGGYGAALLVCLAALLLPLAGGAALLQTWRYERAAVAAGQWWRLLAAHVVHLDVRHALLNGLGAALLWMLFARSYRPLQWLAAIVFMLAAIDAGFWFLSPELAWYAGASALLHGVFACGCVAMVVQGERLGIAAGLALLAKLAWEQLQGPLPMMSGQPVATISHVYGTAGGLLAGLLLCCWRGRLYWRPFFRGRA
jgi:rhomboid family GlyGly-CTERM serine protease